MTTVARTRRSWRLGATWVVILSTLQVLTIAASVGPPMQPIVSVLFVLTCPGFLALDLTEPSDASARLLVGLTSSLAVNVVIFTILVATDAPWLVPVFALVLVVFTVRPRRHTVVSVAPALKLARMRSQRTAPRSVPTHPPAPEIPVQPEMAVPDDVRADPEASAPDSAAPDTDERQTVGAGTTADPGVSVEPDAESDVAPAIAAAGPGQVRPATEPASSSPGSPMPEGLMDVNTASEDQLATLPGIGPALAKRIAAHRNDSGPYRTLDDLLAVQGVGPGKVSGLAGLVALEAGR